MKKIVSLFLTLLLLVTVLSLFACSKKPSDNSSSLSSENSTKSSSAGASNQDTGDGDSSTNSVNSSTGKSSNSSVNSTSNGEANTPAVGQALTYEQRIDAFLDGATIGDADFVKAVKNLGEYQKNATVKADSIFVAPKANGDGTVNSPCSLQTAIDEAKAGQTIYLRGGVYDANAEGSKEGYFLNCKGAKDKLITIRNYPNETPVITNSFVNNAKNTEANAIIVETTCQYVVLEGLEIRDVKSYCAYGICMWEGGQNHIVIRNCSIHDIKTTASNPDKDTESGANAILLFGSTNNSLNNMFIMDNTIYNMVTGWAETLSVTANAEYIYVLANTVHDTSNIAIDFYGNAGYGASPELDQPRYCVASANVISNTFCSYADCAGLYVDGARDIVLQYNTVFNCQYGIEIGSEEKQDKYPVKNILVRNNLVRDNLVTGIRVGGYETNATGVVYSTKIINNTLYNNTKGNNASGEITLAKVDGISFINNIVTTENSQSNLVVSEFSKSYTKNIIFNNNIFFAKGKTESNAEFFMYNSWQEGLAKFESVLNGGASSNYYGEVTFDKDYKPTYSPTFASKMDERTGLYDFYLNQRKQGELEIGAIEK